MEKDIVNEIKAKLSDIEKIENVKILFAIESGSRAWGFESVDSDYDVRFVYVRPLDYYLHLNKKRDVIEYMLNDVYDINGWDLDKSLRLLHSSNPTLFEWMNSPFIYKTTPFHEKLKKLSSAYFLSKSGLNHYLSMAKSTYKEYLIHDIVKLKKYFYAIRPLLACRWILKHKTPPPVLFSELVSLCMEPEFHPIIGKLLIWKTSVKETQTGKPIKELNDWIEKTIVEVSEQINLLPTEDKKDWNTLNNLFLSELGLTTNNMKC